MQELIIALEARNISKRYGRVRALDAVSMSVEKGVIYCLFGPVGSGKSTLLKILCTLNCPDSGDFTVFGENRERGILRWVGYMPKEPSLYDELTVRANLAYFARLYGMTSGQIKWRIAELEKQLAFGDITGLKVRELSREQKQLISLACCMVHCPQILFLDEPLAGIDPLQRIIFWNQFSSFREQGMTIVFSSDSMEETANADKIGVLRKGKLLAQDSPADLMKKTGGKSLEEVFVRLIDQKG